MSKLQNIWTLGMLAFALSGAWAQDSSTPPSRACAGERPAGAGACVWAGECARSRQRESAAVRIGFAVARAACGTVKLFATGSDGSASRRTRTRATSRAVSGSLGHPCAGKRDSENGCGATTTLALDYIGGVGYYSLSGHRLEVAATDGSRPEDYAGSEDNCRCATASVICRKAISAEPMVRLGSQGIGSLGNTSFGVFGKAVRWERLGLAPRILNVSLADVSRESDAQVGGHGGRGIRLHAFLSETT